MFVLVAVSAIVGATPLPAAAGADVSAVRYWTAPDHTRIVVDLTTEASYSTSVLTDPDRVVVLIVDGGIGGAQVATRVGDGLVDRVRLNQLQSGTQVVVDLTTASDHAVFPLKPYLNKPNRIVIDIFHEEQPSAAPRARPSSG